MEKIRSIADLKKYYLENKRMMGENKVISRIGIVNNSSVKTRKEFSKTL